jgi:hypothetical protein
MEGRDLKKDYCFVTLYSGNTWWYMLEPVVRNEPVGSFGSVKISEYTGSDDPEEILAFLVDRFVSEESPLKKQKE